MFDWSWSDPEDGFLRAIELHTGYLTAHHWYAISHLVPRERFDDAREHLTRALQLDPL